MKITCNSLGLAALVSISGALGACGDDNPYVETDSGQDGSVADSSTEDGSTQDGGTDATLEQDASLNEPPTTYTFASRFNDGESGINHAGQTTRQILVADLIGVMTELSDGILGGTIDVNSVDEEGEIVAMLNGVFRSGSTDLGTRALPDLTGDGLPLCQQTYEDLGDANLFGKLAGEDDVTDYKDWDGDDEGNEDGPQFEGWPELPTPIVLVDELFATFEQLARACALDVDDCPSDHPLYVTSDGQDLVQLTQKFLLGAINFSQTADDYLDDATEGKGLLTDNSEARGDGAESTNLEHAWDEGFGYFGAAADYNDYTDDEIRAAGGREAYAGGFHDSDGDGCIDVFTEYNFGASVNAAKRDAGSTTGTDYTKAAFDALVRGRWIISSAGDNLTEAQLAELKTQRDIVVETYEKALAATAVHYINDTLGDLGKCGTEAYSFVDHAKHWSELKGFALSLQFNPRSPWNQEANDFVALHELLDDQPTDCGGQVEARETALLSARAALQAAYGFDATDVENW